MYLIIVNCTLCYIEYSISSGMEFVKPVLTYMYVHMCTVKYFGHLLVNNHCASQYLIQVHMCY